MAKISRTVHISDGLSGSRRTPRAACRVRRTACTERCQHRVGQCQIPRLPRIRRPADRHHSAQRNPSLGQRLPAGPVRRARPARRGQRHLPRCGARPDHPLITREQTKLPRKIKRQVVPLPVEAVTALASVVPPRYRALVVLAAGTGLRQGEAFGLTADRVNFLKRCLTVDRQLLGQENGRPRFGPPKTAASVRTVPLPDV